MVRCAKHPQYTGLRSIRRSGDVCPQCQAIRDEVVKSGQKEKRVRKGKVEVPAVAVVAEAAPVAPVVVEAPQVPVVEPPIVEQPKVDEALPGGLGGDEFDVETGNLDDVL